VRIGMLAPISWRVPPRHYGPWELVVSTLTEGLVRRGVDVTLFATADSITTAKLVAVSPTGYSEDSRLNAKVYEGLHIAAAFERSNEFDLIHNHFDFLPVTYSRLVRTPVVTTIHGLSSEQNLEVFRAYNDIAWLVAISDSDRRPSLRYCATIHHGLPIDDFTFEPTRGDYLLYFGRIHPDKGTAEAIEVARRTDRKLVIAGIIQDAAYFEEEVKPFIDGHRVVYAGSVGPEERNRLLGGALALLHLINFDEPFGLSVIEAMATGTPVIAFRRGSMPEIVNDGTSGFLVDTVDEAIDAVERLVGVNRASVRQWAKEHFSAERMVDDYLELYQRILRQPNRPRGPY
jgi:glycosyltransferase involved in cell wall biosynthesis